MRGTQETNVPSFDDKFPLLKVKLLAAFDKISRKNTYLAELKRFTRGEFLLCNFYFITRLAVPRGASPCALAGPARIPAPALP